MNPEIDKNHKKTREQIRTPDQKTKSENRKYTKSLPEANATCEVRSPNPQGDHRKDDRKKTHTATSELRSSTPQEDHRKHDRKRLEKIRDIGQKEATKENGNGNSKI